VCYKGKKQQGSYADPFKKGRVFNGTKHSIWLVVLAEEYNGGVEESGTRIQLVGGEEDATKRVEVWGQRQ